MVSQHTTNIIGFVVEPACGSSDILCSRLYAFKGESLMNTMTFTISISSSCIIFDGSQGDWKIVLCKRFTINSAE